MVSCDLVSVPGVIENRLREMLRPRLPEFDVRKLVFNGTHTHTVVEHCVKAHLADPTPMIGIRMKDHDGEFIVDAERAARVKVAIDYIRERVTELNGMADVRAEQRVSLEWFTQRKDLGGTVDIQIRGPELLEIIDYKDGIAPVEVEGNPQLESYAVGVLAECRLGWNVPDQYPWKQVRMTVIQPKLALKGLPAISSWTVPVSYLLDQIEVITAEARATDDPNAPLVPGEVQCKYCRAKGGCSALANNIMQEVGVMFSPVVEQTLDVAQQSADKDPATMDNQQIRQIIEAAPLMRQLLEAVEKEALRRMEAGQSIPGLKLVHGRGTRTWLFPEKEMADKLVKMGIPKAAVYETKLVSPAKAEKLTWEKRDGTKVALTERQLKRMETEYVSRVAGKLTVVSESDGRPAVETNAAPLFSAVEAAPAAEPLPSWLLPE